MAADLGGNPKEHFSKQISEMIDNQSKKLKLSYEQLVQKYETDMERCREYTRMRIESAQHKIEANRRRKEAGQVEYNRILEEGKYKGIEDFNRPCVEADTNISRLHEEIVFEEKELKNIEQKILERIACAKMKQNASSQQQHKKRASQPPKSKSGPQKLKSESNSDSVSVKSVIAEVEEKPSSSSIKQSSKSTRVVRRSRKTPK